MKKPKDRYKKGVLPGSLYDDACRTHPTYRGTMQKAAQKKMKDPAWNPASQVGYNSYKILDQLENM